MLFTTVCVKAAVTDMSTANAQNDKKPMAVLIYANWAEGYQGTLAQYKKAERVLANDYNFVELDIASKDAKIFNDKYIIYPKLPYIVLFRDNGRFSVLLTRDCASDSSCIINKLKDFNI